MTTTTIFRLPRDMVEEVLSRVPLKSMRFTCKKWYTLSKNRSFTKMHLAKIAEEGNSNPRMIVLMDSKLYLTSGIVKGTDFDPYIEPEGKLICLNDLEQVKIFQIFHCEGLLLCILKDISKIVVWNPYWGQPRWIEPRYSYGHCSYRYALGYSKKNKKNKSYKILRFIDKYFCPTKSRHHFSWYEIYDLDTGLWKTLVVTSIHWKILSNDLGVSLKGNTYWISYNRKLIPIQEPNVYLICFDFTREMFRPLLPLPPLPGGLWGRELVTLSCVKEEKLAVFYQYDKAPMVEIWITNKIEEEEVLWSKFLTVNMATVAKTPISFRRGDFYIDEEKRLAMVFDKVSDEYCHTVNIIGEDGYFREVDLDEDGSSSKLDVRASRENFALRTTELLVSLKLVLGRNFKRGLFPILDTLLEGEL
ncbi:F-box/kelch-repeat protein At3g16740 [Eutrema salsugineum]|uniref:F-box/kelch-repeat protein At3g16740 n=1 Tax=Eutrema salsugineum TaxID=72664 RepID=UPI000CED5932|nr:F-box/kelch-repeat protein At3g16740 [Eutrema salsugineum]